MKRDKAAGAAAHRSVYARELEDNKYRQRIYSAEEAENWVWMEEGLEDYYALCEENKNSSKDKSTGLSDVVSTPRDGESATEVVGTQQIPEERAAREHQGTSGEAKK